MTICSQCQKEFEEVEDYRDHECSETGYTPKDPEHQGENYKLVQQAALKRGEEQTKS